MLKVCGMREKENINQLVEIVAPDLMGMIFYPPSPRAVSSGIADLDFYKSLKIPKVGVFVDSDPDYIHQIINDYALDFVQLHGHESVEYIRTLKNAAPVKVIKVIGVDNKVDWQEFEPYESWVDLFLFDTKTEGFGGSGIKFNWSVLDSYPFQKKFLLSGGVDEESLETISALSYKVPQLAGVDINSRFESQPGVKDIEKISNFVKEMRNKIV